MKKILFFLVFFNAAFADVKIAPYFYADLFDPGYGVTARVQFGGHAFELAPLVIPSYDVSLGNPVTRLGFTTSYYYAFRTDKIAQPYLGCSYTHLSDLHTYSCRDNSFSLLLGIQFCGSTFPGYLFIDTLAPGIRIYNAYPWEEMTYFQPRIGAGFQF
jgi:hypothetical protein